MKVHERRDIARDLEDDVTAVSPVGAVGPREGLEFFTLDRGAAIATITAGDVENSAVNEGCHGGLSTRADARRALLAPA